ncbi:MAG: hypothetical protein ACI4LM_00670 [Anaerovoracaceae bacterium]
MKNIVRKAIALIASAAVISGAAALPVMADAGTQKTAGRTSVISSEDRAAQSGLNSQSSDEQTTGDTAENVKTGIIKVYLVRNNMKVSVNGKTLKIRGWFFKTIEGEKKQTVAMVPLKATASRLGAKVRKTVYGWEVRGRNTNVLIWKNEDKCRFTGSGTDAISDPVSFGSEPVTKKGVVYVPADVFKELYNRGSEKMEVKLNAQKKKISLSFVNDLEISVNGETLKTRGWTLETTVNGQKSETAMIPMKETADKLKVYVTETSDGWEILGDTSDALIYSGQDKYRYIHVGAGGLTAAEALGAVPVVKDGDVFVPADVFEELFIKSSRKMSASLDAEKGTLSFNID